MTYLIAAAGLSGAGKTTGLQHLARMCDGQYVYLGQTVLEAVRDQGLPSSPENERKVRLALREKHGSAFLVKLIEQKITGYLKTGVAPLLDAIFNPEELDLVRSIASSVLSSVPVYLLGVTAPFDVRCERLRSRRERPCTASELQARDKTELETLGTAEVLQAASHTIVNESSLEVYYQTLRDFLQSITPS
jgi:dephospho-CoA kinase